MGRAAPRRRLPDVHRKVRDADTLVVPVQRIRLYGEVLADFVERWNLLPRGIDMTVPYPLWTASQEEIAAYLRSVFQADGYVTVRRENGCENAHIGFAVIGEQWTETSRSCSARSASTRAAGTSPSGAPTATTCTRSRSRSAPSARASPSSSASSTSASRASCWRR